MKKKKRYAYSLSIHNQFKKIMHIYIYIYNVFIN